MGNHQRKVAVLVPDKEQILYDRLVLMNPTRAFF